MNAATVMVMIAGSRWTNTRGTDHRLAEALAQQVHVLWVDPPVPYGMSKNAPQKGMPCGHSLDSIGPGLMRLQFTAPPGFTRRVVRTVVPHLRAKAIAAAIRSLGVSTTATLVLSPRDEFPALGGGIRALHVTDDWPAGAGMMGLSRRVVQGTLVRNISRADVVSAVSPPLASAVTGLGARNVSVLPNGCAAIPVGEGAGREPRKVAGIIGQLNERLDFDLLDELVDSGLAIEVVGPMTARAHDARARLNRFLAAKNVTWLGELAERDLWPRMREMSVGLTPYADNVFNQASFPVKTLDYLAVGLPVVSTDLPATRWLDTSLITTARSNTDFVAKVRTALEGGHKAEDHTARQIFAAGHSWDARATQLLSLIEEAQR